MLDTLAWMIVAATIVPAHRAAVAERGKLLAALVTLDVIALAMVVVAASDESTYAAIAQEDGSLEWATFLAFMFAAGWLVVRVRKLGTSKLFQVACFLLAAFCVVVAGEEISWGQRLLGFKPPDVFLERNFQQELNVHNVLMNERGLGFKLESKHLVMAIALGFGIAWPLLVRLRRLEPFAPLAPPFAFAPLFLGVVAAEMSYAVDLTGEGAELVLGLLFLAAAFVATEVRPRTIAVWLVATLIGGLLVSTVMSRIVFGSDEDGVRVASAELELLAVDVAAGAMPKLERRGGRVHKRVFTAVVDRFVTLAGRSFLEGQGTPGEASSMPARRDRRGYFLDPWNNPYWMFVDRRTRRGMVYSFGPNRRRDINVREKASDPGDDVIVSFDLARDDEPEQ